jgi:hypothetical protein
MTYIGMSADNADVGHFRGLSSELKDLQDPFIRLRSFNVANGKNLIARSEITFGDVLSSRVPITETLAWCVSRTGCQQKRKKNG